MIVIQREDFDVADEIAIIRDEQANIGAVVSFTGLVRDYAGESPVVAMTLEHYPDMTEKELARIEAEARQRWPLSAVTIIHRVGKLYPGDNIVLVIAASAHRQAAFEAAQFIMDYLKAEAPFWKYEETEDGARWVEAKASDDEAAGRWRRG